MSKIKEFNFSVAIFAPGWTFETIPDIDVRSVNGTDICNTEFIVRNDFFWSSLWKYFLTSGPITLPFYSSFCIGSGKVKRHNGAIKSNQPWFNLSKQEFQPSIPTSNRILLRCFDDCFDGGSCLLMTEKYNIDLRLFVCDFKIQDGIILSFAYKKYNVDVDVECLVNITNDTSHLKIICSDITMPSHFEKANEKHVTYCKDSLLKKIQLQLQANREKCLPITNLVNEWHIRYYYLNFDSNLSDGRITDIGFRKTMKNDAPNDKVLLGALSVHRGLKHIDDDDLTSIEIVSLVLIKLLYFD